MSIEDLAAEARYHRQRMDLYRARMYGPGDTSPAHFRELRRTWELADQRLKTARAEAAARVKQADRQG
jgi:hypothetical protein